MPSDYQPDSRFKRSEAVAHRRIEDEVLLIPIRSDANEGLAVFSLNPTASLRWELLDQARSVADVVAALCERFDVNEDTARADVVGFCRELHECGALEQVGSTGSETP